MYQSTSLTGTWTAYRNTCHSPEHWTRALCRRRVKPEIHLERQVRHRSQIADAANRHTRLHLHSHWGHKINIASMMARSHDMHGYRTPPEGGKKSRLRGEGGRKSKQVRHRSQIADAANRHTRLHLHSHWHKLYKMSANMMARAATRVNASFAADTNSQHSFNEIESRNRSKTRNDKSNMNE